MKLKIHVDFLGTSPADSWQDFRSDKLGNLGGRIMGLRSKTFVLLLVLVSLAACFPVAAGSHKKQGIKVITFDHLARKPATPVKIELANGEAFKVRIENTLPSVFTYELRGVVLEDATSDAGKILGVLKTKDDLTSRVLDANYDDRYGGYILTIEKKAAGEIKIDVGKDKTKELNSATLTIFVIKQGWDYELASGFTLSEVTDPVYAARDDGSGQTIVIRDRDAEDGSTPGVAAMVHVFHTKQPRWAATFGLGINDQSNTTFYLGPSLRLGKIAALTVGYNWTPVSRLPPGLREGDQLSDPNRLANLDTRIDDGWFLGISFTFLNAGDVLQRPFAGSDSPTPSATTTGSDDDDPSGNDGDS